MSIIKNNYLKEKIVNYNLIPLEVRTIKISSQIELNITEVEDFLKFANVSDFKYVYYYYTYYDIEEYIILIDEFNEYSEEFKTAIIQHNSYIKSLDFNSPKSLTLFSIQNGICIGIVLDNPWLENQGVYEAEEAIEELEDKFNHEVKKINEDKREQQKNDENELRNIIYNDPEFRYCKNQELRYWYLVDLLKKEKLRKYDYLVKPYGIPHNGNIKMFMDKTWMLYKERQ